MPIPLEFIVSKLLLNALQIIFRMSNTMHFRCRNYSTGACRDDDLRCFYDDLR
jgi:hypothetical protein